jgi:hypothetical protein
MTAKNDLRSAILSLGLGLVVTGMGVNAIACQNSSNLPPQPPLSKQGVFIFPNAIAIFKKNHQFFR